jgi:hypothetical protein
MTQKTPKFYLELLTLVKKLEDKVSSHMVNIHKREVACEYRGVDLNWVDLETMCGVIRGYSNEEASKKFGINKISYSCRKNSLCKKLRCGILGYHLYRESLRFIFAKASEIL